MRVKKSCVALMIFGALAAVASVVTAVKAAKEEEEIPEGAPIAKVVIEKAKTYWLPAALLAVSILSFVLANRVSLKQTASLAAAYESLRLYQRRHEKQVEKTLGEDKAAFVKADTVKTYVDEIPPTVDNVIDTGNGTTLFYDILSKQYFLSSIDRIRAIQDSIRGKLNKFKFVSFNMFLWLAEIGVKGNLEEIGWNAMDKSEMAIGFMPILTKDGQKCIVLTYRVAPHYAYLKPARIA